MNDRAIDADGHVSEDFAIDWEQEIEEPYKALAPRTVPVRGGFGGQLFVEGRLIPRTYSTPQPYKAGHDIFSWDEGRQGMRDPEVRLQHMDLEGIQVSVLFGGVVSTAAPTLKDPGLAAAVCRVYNTWVARFCGRDPKRLKGIASAPLQHGPAAVEELRRAVTELGAVGLRFPTQLWSKHIDDPSFDPVYEEAQRLDIPVCVHATGGTPGIESPSSLGFDSRYYVNLISQPTGLMVALACVMAGGVMDRYPKLRFAFLEGGTGWVPFWVERMDEQHELLGHLVPAKARPSEYIQAGRCFFSVAPGESTLPFVLERIGEDRVVFASDYFHFDGHFPGAVTYFEELPGLTPAARRKVLRENVLRLFRLS